MRHTVNSVRLRDRTKAGRSDPIADFAALGRDTLGGVRSAAARFLRSTQDVDLSPCLRDALLYGPTAKPFDAGEQAMSIGPGTPRDTAEQEANIFLAGIFNIPIDPAPAVLIYRPTRAQMLHRVLLNQVTAAGQQIALSSRDDFGLPLPGVTPTPDILFWGEVLPDDTKVVPIGRKGFLLTPDNGLFGLTNLAGVSFRITLHLSDAQLRPACF